MRKIGTAKGFFAIKMLSFWAGRGNFARSMILPDLFHFGLCTFFVLSALPSGKMKIDLRVDYGGLGSQPTPHSEAKPSESLLKYGSP